MEELNPENTFDFTKETNLYTKLEDGIYLKLDRLNHSVARLYFVNKENIEIKVPEGFKVFDNTHGDMEIVKRGEQYLLAWTDNYSLMLKDWLITRLVTQRQWSLSYSCLYS